RARPLHPYRRRPPPASTIRPPRLRCSHPRAPSRTHAPARPCGPDTCHHPRRNPGSRSGYPSRAHPPRFEGGSRGFGRGNRGGRRRDRNPRAAVLWSHSVRIDPDHRTFFERPCMLGPAPLVYTLGTYELQVYAPHLSSPRSMTYAESLTSSVLRALPLPPTRRVDAFRSDPVATQRRLLLRLLDRAAGTEWGRRFRFEEILRAPDPVAAYQECVPLHDYEAYREDVERIRRGEPDVIWPGRFTNFAVSSGTASAGKIIPVSDEMLQSNRSFSVAVGLNYLRQTGNKTYLRG